MSMNDFEVAPRGTMTKLTAIEVQCRDYLAQADSAIQQRDRWKARAFEAEEQLGELNEQLSKWVERALEAEQLLAELNKQLEQEVA